MDDRLVEVDRRRSLECAERIREYWRERGYDVTVQVTRASLWEKSGCKLRAHHLIRIIDHKRIQEAGK